MADRAFDKFTKRTKQVLQYATEEARAFNHPYIGTEHILLGLIREGEGVAAQVLNNLGVKLSQARHAVEFIVGVGEGSPRTDQDLTARAKKVIEYAVEETKRLNHHYIGTEHLLLGLVRNGEGVATGVLDILGVSLEQVRTQVMRVLRQGTGAGIERSSSGSSSAPGSDVVGRRGHVGGRSISKLPSASACSACHALKLGIEKPSTTSLCGSTRTRTPRSGSCTVTAGEGGP
jgi:ATP-dependent Clp protease ATP-binding subunit ClpC